MNSNLFISVAIVWIFFIVGSFAHETGDSTHSESPEVQVCQPLQHYLKQTQMAGLDNVSGLGGKGEKGSPGKMGPRGLRGFKGSTGDIGIQGPEGLRGLQGPKGLRGLTGVKGDIGIQGPIGLEGPRGLQGFKGSKGEIGFPGFKGDIGFPGSKGSLGSKGAKGTKGTTTVRHVEEKLKKLQHSFQTDGKKRDQEIETTILQVRNLTSDLQTERIKSQNVYAELKETIVNLQTDNLLLNQSLETTKLHVRNLTSDLQTERQERIQSQTTILQVRNLTSDLQTERIKSQNVSAELKETIVNLQTDNLLLKQSLETTKLQVRNLTSDLQTERQERIKSQNVSAELQETIVQIQRGNLLSNQSFETGVVNSVSSMDDVPSCGASTRGSIRLLPVSVNSALRRDAFIICADLENGKFQWIEVMTNGRIPTNGSSCRELIEPTYLSTVLPDGLYNLTDSNMDSVTGYCDMTTDGGGWLLIGKSFQPNVQNLGSTSEPVTLTSGQGWSNRFPSIVVNDFRVQVSTSSSMEDTKGNWYYHLARPRPLGQLFTYGYGNANGCQGEDGITDIEYTVDIRGGTKNNNHRCSAFQDSSRYRNSFNGINSCFTSTGCYISGNDGSFSFHGQNAISGQDTSSTAFYGCDDYSCCACWGPTGGQQTYCLNNCGTTNGGSKQSSGYAWFYVR